jgi:macrolide transport system ATP-binding/permease protein
MKPRGTAVFFCRKETVVPGAHILFNTISFSYESSVPLFENLTFDSGSGWTGLVGENGSGKTTLCLLAAGLLKPLYGVIHRPDTVFYCPQRTDLVPVGLDSLFKSTDHEARRLCGLLRLESDFPGRWNMLSHGERKKAQAAVARGVDSGRADQSPRRRSGPGAG